MLVRVKVTPGAPCERVVVGDEGRLELYVREPAQGNMANRRAAQLVAGQFNVPPRSVKMVAGQRSRAKTFEVALMA